MNEQNIDVNLVIQSFQERISQLITEIVVKDATIKQLSSALQEKSVDNDSFEIPSNNSKKG
jgi:uncharacterized coiled-coil protein SlyX